MIRWLWTFINAHWWAWRTVHIGWAAVLSRAVHPGAGALWYTCQEVNQARSEGRWQEKNTFDLLAGYLGEGLGLLWRIHA